MKAIIISNATLVTSESMTQTDVFILDDKVASLGARSSFQVPEGADCMEIDASGALLLPGCIDAHCHILLDTGIYRTPDDWSIGSRAAAIGGITTVVDFVSPLPGETLGEALDARRHEAAASVIDYTFHMTILNDSPETLAQIAELPALGIRSLKMYTTYRPNYYLSDSQILNALKVAGAHDIVTLVHCENDAIVTDATQALFRAGQKTAAVHPRTRPAIAETEAAQRILSLARYADAPVVIAHNSSAETPLLVAEAKKRGQRAYCESAPQYLYLDDSLYASEEPWRYILQPPLRSRSDVDGLRRALADGHIDFLITDHCDYTKRQKLMASDLSTTPGGLPGLQTLVMLAGELTQEVEGFKWTDVVRVLCENPAKIYGLWPKKGNLGVGADADFIIVRPESGIIDESKLTGCAQYSPFHHMRRYGRITDVYRRGKALVHNRYYVGEDGTGEFIRATEPVFE